MVILFFENPPPLFKGGNSITILKVTTPLISTASGIAIVFPEGKMISKLFQG